MEISLRENLGFHHSNLRNGDVASNSAVFTEHLAVGIW